MRPVTLAVVASMLTLVWCTSAAGDDSGVAQCLRAETARFPNGTLDDRKVLWRAHHNKLVIAHRVGSGHTTVYVWARRMKDQRSARLYLLFEGRGPQHADSHETRRFARRAVTARRAQVLLSEETIGADRHIDRRCLVTR